MGKKILERMKKNYKTVLCILALLLGVGLVAYPSFSNYWNSFHQTRAIADYEQKVSEMGTDDKEKLWEEAQAYNAALAQRSDGEERWLPTEEEEKEYEGLLDVSGTGVMGSVEIPSLDISLPIYHGTDEGVLQIAVGHIEGSSLPVGGEGTHCVISGHRGLPSATLFSNLDELKEGDIFRLNVLDETLTYEVDQIHIVLPNDLDDLEIEEGEDLCTLVTCTPYGINTHRLLVRGHRVENQDTVRVRNEAYELDSRLLALILAAPVLLILLICLLVKSRRHR